MGFIYLGSPYTHKNEEVMQVRYEVTEAYTAHLLKSGRTVYSPIVHCHNLAVKNEMPKDFAFWMDHNFAMLEKADSFFRLQLPGWEKSAGLIGEHSFFIGLLRQESRWGQISDIFFEEVEYDLPDHAEQISFLKEHS